MSGGKMNKGKQDTSEYKLKVHKKNCVTIFCF